MLMQRSKKFKNPLTDNALVAYEVSVINLCFYCFCNVFNK